MWTILAKVKGNTSSPNGLCPNRHLKAHDSMEGTREARELDGDRGRDQLLLKVRGHVDGLSGLTVSSKLLGPSTTMSVNKRKLRKICPLPPVVLKKMIKC